MQIDYMQDNMSSFTLEVDDYFEISNDAYDFILELIKKAPEDEVPDKDSAIKLCEEYIDNKYLLFALSNKKLLHEVVDKAGENIYEHLKRQEDNMEKHKCQICKKEIAKDEGNNFLHIEMMYEDVYLHKGDMYFCNKCSSKMLMSAIDFTLENEAIKSGTTKEDEWDKLNANATKIIEEYGFK